MTESSDFLPTGRQERLPRQLVLVVFDGTDPLDLIGPISVFSRAEARRPGSYTIRVGSVEKLTIGTPSPLTIGGIEPLSDIAGAIDTILVTGGTEPAIRRAATDDRLIKWLVEKAGTARRVGSICTGAFVLGAAGLIDGRKVTTHWAAVDILKAHFPRADVDADAIYRVDGQLCTSAGVSAGIDLALALVAADIGHSVAVEIARELVLFLHRPGGQRQFSATLAAQTTAGEQFSELLAWILDNPCADLRVPALAERVAMSPRNFARRFLQTVGVTPARYVLQTRLDQACHYLETTEWTVARVADRSGLQTADMLHRVFRQSLGVTPLEYRDRFSSRGIEEQRSS